MDAETLDKIAKKRWYKLRGVISAIELHGKGNSITNVLISKGSGKAKKLYYFTSYGVKALELAKLSKGFRIKVWFSIVTNEHNGKYYPNLKIESFEHWIVNEEKIKKQQKIEELAKKQAEINWGESDFDSGDIAPF
jgi:hypothetical protein